MASRLLKLSAAPAVEPLTLAETKLFLRVDGSIEDTLITSLIAMARQAAEEYMRKSLISQSWMLAFDDYVPYEVMLPKGPVQSITSVKSIERDESETVISSQAYYLNAAKDALVFDSEVYGHRVEIIYVTGYGNSADVPQSIKSGLLQHIAQIFGNRSETEIPIAAKALYNQYREVSL